MMMRFFWHWITFIFSVLLCLSRLTSTLGYEHAFMSGLLMSVIGGHVGLREVRFDTTIWKAWIQAAIKTSWIGLIPLVLGALNGLRVGSCDALEGVGYYLLLPMITCWVASAWGVFIGLIGRGIGTYMFAYLCSLLYVGAQVWWTPIVDPFHSLFGYYPGAIYDELLMIDTRLWWSRFEDLLWPLTALLTYQAWRQPDLPKIKKQAGFAIMILLGAWLNGNRLDIRRTHGHVQARLGGYYETEHFHVYYPKRWQDKEINQLAQELEFLYQELTEFFGQGSSRKVSAYFYSNARQKKRLMGAARTRIAKPWQYAIHVHDPVIGQSVLKHELAHVFSADIAPTPHHLSLYHGIFPHMPLIEGLAEAATWSEGALTPHQLTAALRQEGFAPSMEGLLSPQGFYMSSSRISYTMCGSFVRFFREQRGQAALAELYASGGQIGLENQKELIKQWEQMIDAIELNPQERRVVAQLLNQPSIFYKVCAHEVAELRAKATGASLNGAWEKALEYWRQLRSFSVGDRGSIFGEVTALYQLKQWEELLTFLQHELKTTDIPLKLRLEEWRLDLNWLRDDVSLTSVDELFVLDQGYAQLLTQLPDRSDRRRVSVKRLCIQKDIELLKKHELNKEDTPNRIGAQVAHLLLDSSKADPSYREVLQKLAVQNPTWEVLYYLRARAEIISGNKMEAIDLLKEVLASTLSDSDLRYESELLIARLIFFQDEVSAQSFQDAAQRYQNLAQSSELKLTEGERTSLEEWSRRALWFAKHVQTTNDVPSVKLLPNKEDTPK